MIMSLGNAATRDFVETGKCKFPGLDEALADQRLNDLNAATKLSDLSPLKSVHLHKLKPPLQDFWSINIGKRWRLIFKFEDGHAYEATILDPH